MKKFILGALCIVTVGYFISCVKTSGSSYQTCDGVEPAKDSAALLHFAADSITVAKDSFGVYYQIIDSGAGVAPDITSGVTVTYTGRLMDNTIFDVATNSNLGGLQLSQLIAGWQIGLTKIKEGGHIKLLVPSAYAWGCQGSGAQIPPNAPVYFDIYLLKVN